MHDGGTVESVHRRVQPGDESRIWFDVYGEGVEDPMPRLIVREWHSRPEVCHKLLYSCSIHQELLLSDYQRERKTEDRLKILEKHGMGVSRSFKVGGHRCGGVCGIECSPAGASRRKKYVACNVLEQHTRLQGMYLAVDDDGVATVQTMYAQRSTGPPNNGIEHTY